MSPVRVLPDETVNQIAAGEVIERPASVVKELVENALDAEATRVDVAITAGGVRSIRVTDDGSGMGPEDAERAFERHATSKIASAQDLAGVGTLGFRGEALPSIAAVARVRMRTRRPQDRTGTELAGEGRGIEKVSPLSCPPGTRVEVAELFGRVPARRKFLKSFVTEAGHIVRWMERIALVRADVRFELVRDGRSSILFLPTADFRERVIAVLPPSAGERLIEVRGESGPVRITGFTSPTDAMWGSPAHIHVYVNARPVRDRLLLHAVREAYRDALPPGRHPAAVLYLQADPGEVDVNVHPAKQEVRFHDPGAVVRLVRGALVTALGRRSFAYTDLGRAPTASPVAESAPVSDFELARPLVDDSPTTPLVPEAAPSPGAPVAFRSLRYLGQALGTYLVLEAADGLVLLDQHAAHERVLFERLRAALREGRPARQGLLVPVWADLGRAAAETLEREQALLEGAGFELEFGARSARGGVRVALRAVPALIAARPGTDWVRLLEETAEQLLEPVAHEARDGLDAALRTLLATAACHAACRQGDRLEPREIEALLAALDAFVWFPNCPHGRPLLCLLERAELERRFLRR